MNEEQVRQVRAIYNYIKVNPGRNACQVARALRMTDGAVRNALAATEKMKLLLYEDGKGRLYVSEESALLLARADDLAGRQWR